MANKKQARVPIDRTCFLRVIHDKGFTVETLGKNIEVQRSGKTIQRCLSEGMMPPELLDRIGYVINVDPEYLAGKYDQLFEEKKQELASPDLTHYLWTKTERFPYSKSSVKKIDYAKFILEVLKINSITKDQFLALNPETRKNLQFDLAIALNGVIKKYFEVDSNDLSTEMGMTTDGVILLMGDWIK